MSLTFLDCTNPELARAWEQLKALRGDYSEECSETGERWQYMGTSDTMHATTHQFRHRCVASGSGVHRTHDNHSRLYLNIAGADHV